MQTLSPSFDAAGFLGGLFAPDPVPAPVPTSPGPAVPAAPGPCQDCGCAIAWRLPSGDVLCAKCHPRPDGAIKAVVVDLPGGPEWREYVAELAARQATHPVAPDPPEPGDVPGWDEADELPAPCPQCGSLAAWWTPNDGPRCMKCHPPTTALRTLQHAERIRRRLRLPSPPGAAEMLADLRRMAKP